MAADKGERAEAAADPHEHDWAGPGFTKPGPEPYARSRDPADYLHAASSHARPAEAEGKNP